VGTRTSSWSYFCSPRYANTKLIVRNEPVIQRQPPLKNKPRKPKPGRPVAKLAPVARPRGPRRSRRATGQVTLSPAALKYALAIADPWHDKALGVSVPIAAGLTQKVHAYIRSQAVIGAGGTGFILVMPSLANDQPQVFVSTSAYMSAGEIIPVSALDTLNTGVRQAFANLPYSATQLTQNDEGTVLSGRVVTASVRTRYIGTFLNQSGLRYHYRSQKHRSVQQRDNGIAVSAAETGEHRECWITKNDGRMTEISDFAISEPEMRFQQFSLEDKRDDGPALTQAVYPFTNGNNSWGDATGTQFLYHTPAGTRIPVGSPTMIVLFTGVPGEAVEYEFMIHCEYSGRPTEALGTHTHGDAIGAQKVMAAGNATHVKRTSQPSKAAWSMMASALREGEQDVKQIVIPEGEAAVALLIHSL
jgi:hypothetical protein